MPDSLTWQHLRRTVWLACRDFARAAIGLGAFAYFLFLISPQPQMELIGRALTGFDVEADVGRMLFLAMGFIQAIGCSAIIGVLSLVMRTASLGWRVGQQHLRNRPGTEAAHV